ncbi:MAG: DNA-processing protein DprA [Candidatus Pacebacteria bacterium]|nr:DNA-processing protein DprA [Candidatus Paceibacterota bacterium]
MENPDLEIFLLTPEQFPSLLREINDPPKKLWLLGRPFWLDEDPEKIKFLCVVGSRKYSEYGRRACESLIADLAEYFPDKRCPVVVVSGLALGIDAVAHRAALSAGLRTIAFPGSGLQKDFIYPPSHRNLAREIIASGGALLSEEDPDACAAPWMFPKRNRLMAGMSHAVLIVEAEKGSGTLITSRRATDYNRDVLTIPGSIFSSNSYGPHMLIRDGAVPITCSEDILEVFGLLKDSEAAEKTNIPVQVTLDLPASEEQKIADTLQIPQTIDQIIQQTNLPAYIVRATLSLMEINGLIKKVAGIFYKK